MISSMASFITRNIHRSLSWSVDVWWLTVWICECLGATRMASQPVDAKTAHWEVSALGEPWGECLTESLNISPLLLAQSCFNRCGGLGNTFAYSFRQRVHNVMKAWIIHKYEIWQEKASSVTEALDCESETQVLVPALRLAIRVTRLTLEALVSSPGRQRGQIREESHGWRSLVGFSPWGREESDKTEQLHFHFSLSCIGEGDGNPLQCSCLENPRDGGAWWAAVYGVAQSQTRLKRLSSSSRVILMPTVWDW